MKIDETQLVEFFGVLPVTEDREEKEFFGSYTFEITDCELRLPVSFSSHHSGMNVLLYSGDGEGPVLRARLRELSEVKIQCERRLREVVGKTRDLQGNDPQVVRRALIYLNPLKVDIEDAWRQEESTMVRSSSTNTRRRITSEFDGS